MAGRKRAITDPVIRVNEQDDKSSGKRACARITTNGKNTNTNRNRVTRRALDGFRGNYIKLAVERDFAGYRKRLEGNRGGLEGGGGRWGKSVAFVADEFVSV